MAAETLISLDQYLHTSYRPDCDFVDGEVQERNWGEKDHSQAQGGILLYLCAQYPRHAENIYLDSAFGSGQPAIEFPMSAFLRKMRPMNRFQRTRPSCASKFSRLKMA